MFVSAAANAAPVKIRVVVSGSDTAVSNAYVALYAADDPWRKPSYETVANKGTASFEARVELYRVFVGAPGYQTALQRLDVTAVSSPAMTIPLMPLADVSGVVRGPGGSPIRGAMVSAVDIAVSELGTRHLVLSSHTTTDADGRWTLSLPPERNVPLLIEAPAFAPAWHVARPAETDGSVVVQRGGSLRVQLDHADATLLMTLVAESGTDVPSGWQRQVWSRPLTSSTVEWNSLTPGKYRVIVQSKERSALIASDVANVAIQEGETSQLKLTLPALAPAKRVTTFFVPGSYDFSHVRGFSGALPVATALESATEGILLYLGTDTEPSELYATTSDHLIVAQSARRPVGETRPFRAVAFDRGTVAMRLVSADADAQLPSVAYATFRDCEIRQSVRLAVELAKDGRVTVPTPIGCRTLVLQASGFALISEPVALKRGETKWLGELRVAAGAEAEVRVKRRPSGGAVAGAVVRAWRRLDDGRDAVIDERIANDAGVVVMPALPVKTEVRIEAREERALASGWTTLHLVSGERRVIDPLAIDDPATITIAPHLSSRFHDLYPKARITAVAIQPEPAEDADRQTRSDRLDEHGGVTFLNVRPGRWQPRVVVDSGESAQPMDTEGVDLAPGEQRKLAPEIEPLVFEGRLVGGDAETQWTLSIADPDGPEAISRHVQVRLDQTFSVILPRRGAYHVAVRPGPEGENIDVGDVEFSEPQQPVTITVPNGSAIANVRDGKAAAANVALTLTLRQETTEGSRDVVRRAESDASGAAQFAHLLPGRWLARAMTADHRSAEKAVVIDAGAESLIELDLQPSAAIRGVVRDSSGQPTGFATVECIVTSATGPAVRSAIADSDGSFSIDLSDPPPLARCSAMTAAGAVGAFLVSSTAASDLVLPQETGALTVADWGTRLPRGDLWLVASDGRVIDLSSVAGKIGRLWEPLTIPYLPSGTWRVVRIGSLVDWTLLASGLGESLKSIAEARVSTGQSQSVRVYEDAQNPETERSH